MVIRVKGVKKVRAPNGRVYYYHRATGARLPDDPRSAEFLTKLTGLSLKVDKTALPGTLGGLIERYQASPEWISLAPATQKEYGRVFKWFWPGADAPLARIDEAFLYQTRDRAMAQHKRGFANALLKLIQSMWNWGLRRGLCTGTNPALAVERIKRPRNAPVKNRPWRPEELAAVLAEASPPIRVAVAIAAYAGLRESDVVRVTWSCYDGQAIETKQQKTGNPVWVPAHYRLREILDSTPRVSPLVVIGEKGKPYTKDTLRNLFFRLIGRLAREGKVGPGLSFHGLRHTLGTQLAEAGGDAQTIASILGQRSTAMAEHYSRTANRRGNASAAIERLEQRDKKRQ